MKMTPKVVVIGSLLILGVIVLVMVVVPYFTRIQAPSEIFRDRTAHRSRGKANLHCQRLPVLSHAIHPCH